MKKTIILFLMLVTVFLTAFQNKAGESLITVYSNNLAAFNSEQQILLSTINASDITDSIARKRIISEIGTCRRKLKAIDIWLRYLEPNAYRLINGPLPVEWETEVFEKFEKPYRRTGAGLAIAETYLNQQELQKDSLVALINSSIKASAVYSTGPVTKNLMTADAFFLSNRLYLLNLAAIYATGFECPNQNRVIPELENMLSDTEETYESYNVSFKGKPLTGDYLRLYDAAINFVRNQPKTYAAFDHFTFIKDYVNPLFALNQKFIRDYGIVSKSNLDFSLNDQANSIFDKSLYLAQNTKGIFAKVTDSLSLKEMDSIGKLLFYDPILSGNNLRSCASCHKPDAYFTNNSGRTSLQFNKKDMLLRNTPSLLNVPFNHLVMLDGNSLSLTDQGKTVISNPIEMGCNKEEVIDKVLSCKTYKKAFKKLAKLTPLDSKISIAHIISAITFYYGKFSNYYSRFDYAMIKNKDLSADEKKGFNLYMGKAQCATCHFSPTFSGIKPPFIGNEFEVIGVPSDSTYKHLSDDKGRYVINPAKETLHAFRTTTLRNAANTKPYMHNGVFKTLEEVVDFYDGGGGSGHKLQMENQTLAADSLHLTPIEKKQLVSFIKSLNEDIKFEKPPASLPVSKKKILNTRRVGGEY